MRIAASFLRKNRKWIFMIFLCGLMMAFVMFLNGIEANEIAYGMLICLFLLAGICVVDGIAFSRRCRALDEMKQTVATVLLGMPKAVDEAEIRYQELIEILFLEKARIYDEAGRKEKDLMEYYTMWVHQIKTPISALGLLLQEKDDEGVMTEELEELFRISQYVEMALQYTRLDSESTDFVIRNVPLDNIVREAIHKYARLFIHKKISLDFEETGEQVLTDEKWMVFVIEQILSNAIKYTQKGSISIYMEDTSLSPALPEEALRRPCLVIEDTGIGIAAEDLPRVCEKGYTGYNGHSDKRSTGIGLYLCSRILKKLAHEIKIESLEGEGTKVRILFPVRDKRVR